MRDLRFVFRTLRCKPLYTIAALLTLTLGIGSNTAIYSLAYSLLWNPLNLPDSDPVVLILERRVEMTEGWIPTSLGNLADYQRSTNVFSSVSAYRGATVNLTSAGSFGGDPERLRGVRVLPNFFDTVGLRPALGRFFREGDDTAAIISHDVWERRFASDPDIVGKTIALDWQEFHIAGVMPEDTKYPGRADVWLPLNATPAEANSRASHDIFGVARLKQGATLPQAAAELKAVAQRLSTAFPRTNDGWIAVTTTLRDFELGKAAKYVAMLLCVTGFVLLIACANIGNLQLARSGARKREIAIRTALGATRFSLIRLVALETVTLAIAGAFLSLLVSVWTVDLLRSLLPAEVAADLPGWQGMRVTAVPIAATFLAALIAGLLTGLMPALQLTRKDVHDNLKAGARLSESGYRGFAAKDLLIAAEVAIAMVLLVGAGLMTRGLLNAMSAGPRVEPETLVTFRVALPETKYAKPSDVLTFQQAMMTRIRSIPNVRSASAATALPHTGAAAVDYRPFTVEGEVQNTRNHNLSNFEAITPSYFETLQIPLLQGRTFEARDSANAPAVAIVNASVAARYWPGTNPIGRRIRVGSPWLTVVGVVADAQHHVFNPPMPTIYVPITQSPSRAIQFAIRVTGEPAGVISGVREAVRNLDRELPVYSVKTMQDLLTEEVSGIRAVSMLMSLFGGIALALACVGIYGVVAFTVSQKIPEIGIRIALGATGRQIVSGLLGRTMLFLIGGVAVGTVGAWAGSRAIASLLIGPPATEYWMYAGVAGVLILMSLIATLVPVARATKVDPIRALRHE